WYDLVMGEAVNGLEWCAELVAYACKDRCVPVASAYKPFDRVWVTPRHLKQIALRRAHENGVMWGVDEPMPKSFGSTMLKRAAKAGLIAGRDRGGNYQGSRAAWHFTTIELAAAWDAELGLSDGERAERAAETVRAMYPEQVARRGDVVSLWPV